MKRFAVVEVDQGGASVYFEDDWAEAVKLWKGCWPQGFGQAPCIAELRDEGKSTAYYSWIKDEAHEQELEKLTEELMG